MLDSHATRQHFHAGHNDAGYLPESDVETFTSFADAKSYMISELLWAADNIASWADEHDCDDVPCPKYGDECPEQLASSAALEAEALNLENGPGWQTFLSDGRSLPVSWWITPCQDTDCAPEPDEDTARLIASEWHGGQSSALYAFASSGHVAGDLWAEIRREVTDAADCAYLLAFLGDEPSEPDCWACTDCIMLIANGETPAEMSEDETVAFLAEFERRTTGYHAVPGDDEQEFSWSSCDTCGSRLGGARHAVTLLPADEPSPKYSRKFVGLGDVWEVRWHGGSTFNIYLNAVEVDVFTRYGDDRGNPPTLEQARQYVEDWAARTDELAR